MVAHRYWRLIGVSAQGTTSNLSLTEIQLLSSAVSVTNGITPTSNYAPNVGTLSLLSDGDTTSAVSFARESLFNLYMAWDFNSTPFDISDIRFGSSTLQSEFLISGTVQFSDDNTTWYTSFQFAAPVWPGSNALTTSSFSHSYWDLATRNSNPPITVDGTTVSPVHAGSSVRGLIYRGSGIYQFEVKFVAGSTAPSDSIIYLGIGITSSESVTGNVLTDPEAYSIYTTQPAIFGGVSSPTYGGFGYGPNFTSGDVVGVVANFNTGSLEFFINGISKGVATASSILGKSIVPVVCDTSGYTPRHLTCTLKINSFDFPIAEAEAWDQFAHIDIDSTIFRTYGGSESCEVFFPNAANATGNFLLSQVNLPKQGNYTDPGIGIISGYVTSTNQTQINENTAVTSLLFATHFNGVNGSNAFVDDKGHNIVTFGGCKIEVDGISAINRARRSVLYSPGDSGNGIRIPISSLADPLNLSNGDFTIRTWFWLKEDAIPNRYGIFSWGGGYNYSYANIRLDMRTNTSVAITLRSQNAGNGPNDIASYQEIPGSFPGKNQWVHIALTREGPFIRLWINGKKQYEASTPYPIHDSYNLTSIDIGSAGYDARIGPAPSDGANGYYDDFQIFNTCLYKGEFAPDVTKEYSIVPTGAVVSRKIDLFRESDGLLVRQTWSDPITGIYKFDELSNDYTYSIVGYDHTNQFKSSIVNGRNPYIALTGPSDLYFSSVIFLANFNSTFTDVREKVITVTGSPAINSLIPFAGGNAVQFDGLTQSSITLANSNDFVLNVPFTVEGWFYQQPGGEAAQGIVNFGGINGGTDGNYQPMNVYTDGSNIKYFVCSSASTFGVPVNAQSFGNVNENSWNHYAICWDGTAFRAFMNGVLGNTTNSTTGPYNTVHGVMFGAYPRNQWNTQLYAILKGALGPQRITKGISRYVGNFTPTQTLFLTQ